MRIFSNKLIDFCHFLHELLIESKNTQFRINKPLFLKGDAVLNEKNGTRTTGMSWEEGVNNIVVKMFTFQLFDFFFLALSNNWGMRRKVKTKSTCNSQSGFPLWAWIEIWKLESHYDFIFFCSRILLCCFSSLSLHYFTSSLKMEREKWNNWRLFMRRFSDYGKKIGSISVCLCALVFIV